MGSSASNGLAERGVQTVEGQIRVLKDASETRVGARESELTTLRGRSGLSGIHRDLVSHCTMTALPYAGCGER